MGLKFKVGDRVVCKLTPKYATYGEVLKGELGTVFLARYDCKYPYAVQFDNPKLNTFDNERNFTCENGYGTSCEALFSENMLQLLVKSTKLAKKVHKDKKIAKGYIWI